MFFNKKYITNGCTLLALNLLKDAADEITGRGDAPVDERLKENAMDFFFSKESEHDLKFWCEVACVPISYFRSNLEKYK